MRREARRRKNQEPIHQTRTHQLVELVGKEKLSRLLSNLAEMTGIPLFLMDAEGNCILESTSAPQHGPVVRPLREGFPGRSPKKLNLVKEVQEGKKLAIGCGWDGFSEFAAPIIVNDQLLGIITGAQINSSPERLKSSACAISEVMTEVVYSEFELDSLSREILSKYEELALLYETSEALVTVFDVKEISRVILERSVEVVGARKASMMLLDEETGELAIVAAHGLDDKIVKGTTLKIGEGIAGWPPS